MKGGLPFSETDSLSISSSPQEVHSGVDLISSSELETPNGRGPLLHRQIFFKSGLYLLTVSWDDSKQNFKNFKRDLLRIIELSSEIPNLFFSKS